MQDALRNPCNQALLDGLVDLHLPDAWLVGGCLFQTVWNLLDGRAPGAGIRDYDVFYFDTEDLSDRSEQAVNRQAQTLFSGLGVQLDVRNQARVHTWYAAYFGRPCPPLQNSCEGVDRFLVGSTSVGLRREAGHIEVYAPYGLDDMYRGILSPNPRVDHGLLYENKVRDYQARWHWLSRPDPAALAAARQNL
ncbi:nucleotidyltransferase family protein [Polaromonas sp. YR568]|uniref:nucleotidyltransferase family protein n=1 Tax=Polaromonas sp. YR568 TaxID=1855301 RepID=UPI003137D3C4